LECGSASYRRSLESQGGSFAAALHGSRQFGGERAIGQVNFARCIRRTSH